MNEELQSAIDRAIAGGVEPELIAEVLDALVDWRAVVPGPVGEVMEAGDGPAFLAIVEGVESLIPRIRAAVKKWWSKRGERKAKRTDRRVARKAKKD